MTITERFNQKAAQIKIKKIRRLNIIKKIKEAAGLIVLAAIILLTLLWRKK